MIIFQNTETNQQYSFYEKVNLVLDQTLSVALAKENFSNKDSKIIVGDGSLTPIYDLFQIKIVVKGTGFFIANFSKDKMNEQLKDEIFAKLKTLKSEQPLNDESQKEKVRKALEFVSEYNPLFISFVNNGSPILTKSDFNLLIDPTKFETTLLVLMLPIDYIIPQSSKPEKKFSLFKAKEPKPNEPQPVKEKPIEQVSDVPAKTNKEILKKYGYDYLFLALFTLIISASFMFGLALAFKGEMSSIFLFIITALFFGILIYAIRSYEKSVPNWKYNFNNIKFPVLAIILGLGIGIGVGYLIVYFIIKGTEENPLDYGKILLISALSTTGMTLLAMVMPEAINFIQKKFIKK